MNTVKIVFFFFIFQMNSPLPDKELRAAQEQRTQQRLEHIRTLKSNHGKHCNIVFFGGKKSTATFHASDRDDLHYCLENLTTPMGTVKWALVRTTDIESIYFQ